MPTNSPSSSGLATNQSPKGVALSSVRTSVTSLRKHLSPIILKAGESHIDSLHKLLSKVRQFVKMEGDEEFIPRSARLIEFEFRTSKQVEDSPAFQAINAETILIVKEFRLSLKKQIMATLKIEIDILKKECYQKLMKSINTCVTAHLISEQSTSDVHTIISTIYNTKFESMLGHTDLDLEEFNLHYKEAFSLPIFPIPAPVLPTTPDATNSKLERETESSRLLLYSTFTNPGLLYFQRTDAIEIEISLKKLHATDALEEATIDTATRLTNETSVDTDILNDLINASVTARTKKMSSEIGQLKKALAIKNDTSKPSVNNRRGPNAPGASSTKKKSRKKNPAPKATAPKVTAQKAGAAANATSKKPRKQPNKSAKKKKGAKK